METKFAAVREAAITKAIVSSFSADIVNYAQSDVIIVGGGPSGLTAGYALSREGVKTLLVESNNYLGGGFWIGGYLMNKLTFRAPAQEFLEELGIPYESVEKGLFLADAPLACSTLISQACKAGLKILNATEFDDVILKNNKVEGAVVNWHAVSGLPRQITCADPIALEAKIVIDATGHDALVAQSLAKRKLINVEGFSALWVEKSEDEVVAKTGEIFPGLIATGMAVATVYGIPRMGPTFGGMLLSGLKAAQVAVKQLKETANQEAAALAEVG